MSGILAIDPAWTAHHPSGVAAVRREDNGWRLAGVAPSGPAFVALASNEPVDWDAPATPGLPAPEDLLAAASVLVGEVEVVTVDMPVALAPFDGRREADSAISRTFGGQGCSTHSPTAVRPGPLGRGLSEGFAAAGYPVASALTPAGQTGMLLEVYPHPALLRLLDASYRLPYKVQGVRRYWPGLTRDERRENLATTWQGIVAALSARIEGADLPLPGPDRMPTIPIGALKRYEDALDALVCAWVGVEYLARRCVAYGDDTAAIWVPTVDLPPAA